MGKEPDRIRREIERTREEIALTAEALRRRTAALSNVAATITSPAKLAMRVVGGVGSLLGLRGSRSRNGKPEKPSGSREPKTTRS